MLLAAVCGPAPAAASPLLQVETDFGSLKVVPLQDFDPPAPGEVLPPTIPYATTGLDHPLTVQDADSATESLLPLAMTALAELRQAGWVSPEAAGLADLSAREFTLVVAHMTRRALDVPLVPAGVDEFCFEELLASRFGVCRHVSRFGEAAFSLLQGRCPAARDLRLTSYGDANTHSWIRAAAMVPKADGWQVVETHFDVSSPESDGLFADVSQGDYTQRYPLAAIVLDRSGQHALAADAYRAFIQDETHENRAVTAVALLLSFHDQGQHQATLTAGELAWRTLDAEQQLMGHRSLPTTVEQALELRVSSLLALDEALTAAPSAKVPAGLPPPDSWEARRISDRLLYTQVKDFLADVDRDMAQLDLERARRRFDETQEGGSSNTWAYRAAYAESLSRAKRLVRRVDSTPLLLTLVAERQRALPDDDEAAADLSNVLLRHVQELKTAQGSLDPQTLLELTELMGRMPTALPESHMVRALIAAEEHDPTAQRQACEDIIRSCDAMDPAKITARERQFKIHALLELQGLAAESGDGEEVAGRASEALAELLRTSAIDGLDENEVTNLITMWWDVGITLTIADCDPALALRVWQAFEAWRPGEARARYGLSRGLVQLALHQLEQGDEATLATAREAVRSMRATLAMDVPVPNSQAIIRLAWFNLATGFENAGRLEEALEIERALAKALPEEPAGSILVVRTLALLVVRAQEKDACADATVMLDEGESLLAALEPGAALEPHIQASAAIASHTLAVASARCDDRSRASRIVALGRALFPDDANLTELEHKLQ